MFLRKILRNLAREAKLAREKFSGRGGAKMDVST